VINKFAFPVFFLPEKDPDYQKLLDVFRPIQELLKERPRADMSGFAVLP